MKDPD